VKVLVALVSAPVDTDPEVPLLPLHAPDAVHVVALVDDHERVADEPVVIVEGLEEKVMVGSGVCEGWVGCGLATTGVAGVGEVAYV
jgi:hypothetical protein